MKRMKTFAIYALCIIGFYLFSVAAERVLINQMYVPMTGSTNGDLIIKSDTVNSELTVEVLEASSTRQNGRIKLKVTNTSGHYIEKCAARIDLFTKRNVLAATEYWELNNFEVDESRIIEIKFTATDVTSYKVTLQEEAPYKDPNVVNILGWNVNLKNILGLDLSKYKNMIDGESIKNGLSYRWGIALDFARSLPTWVYVVATGIVVWHLPKGYLFGLIPF